MEQNLYERIKKNANGKSDYRIELELGLPRDTLKNLKKSMPSAEKLYQIAKYLNVSMEYLLTGEETQIGNGQKNFQNSFNNSQGIVLGANISDINNNISNGNNNSQNSKYHFEPLQIPKSHEKVHQSIEVLGNKIQVPINKQCPICRNNGKYQYIASFPKKVDYGYIVYSFFCCNHCDMIFAVRHFSKSNSLGIKSFLEDSNESEELMIVDDEYVPFKPAIKPLPECFDNENFKKTIIAYNELQLAKEYNIHNLAGFSYRQTLEFMIIEYLKSYKIEKYNQLKEETKKKRKEYIDLSKFVEIFTDDDEAKNIADQIRKVGNNFTHYDNYATDEEYEDLANLLEIITKEIERYIIKEKTAKKYPKKKKQGN